MPQGKSLFTISSSPSCMSFFILVILLSKVIAFGDTNELSKQQKMKHFQRCEIH